MIALALAGCDDDSALPKKTPSPYANLTAPVDVLHNLELAMNDMNSSRYVELLDPDEFKFYFDASDVGWNGIPESWGFVEESAMADTLLGGKGGIWDNPAVSIDLDLVDFENAVWVEFDPTNAPGQLRTTVSYNFTVDTEDETTLITAGTPRAGFTIKQENVGGKMIWRLVEWEDLADTFASKERAAAGTEETNWGRVKFLYR